MSEEKEKKLSVKETTCKLNMYCIHRLLWDNKRLGQTDKDIWMELKELFQSADYSLSMELRPIEMLWGDTQGIDNFMKEMSGTLDKEKSRKTEPSN
jgi:hypothetical protein